MLTEHQSLAGTMPVAFTETAHRLHEVDGQHEVEETRFRFVCDEVNGPLAAVTGRYTVVQNRDLVSALDLAAGQEGLELEPTEAVYRNGRAQYSFRVPNLRFRAPGDRSETEGTIVLGNDYRGQGGLKVMSGWFRLICTNGMVIGTTAHKNLIRHVGEIDVMEFVTNAVAGMRDKFEVERVLAETLAQKQYRIPVVPTVEDARAAVRDSESPSLIMQIVADTAPRYEQYLHQAVRENQRDMGENLWALAQAVSETSTHRMRGFAADEWATRQLNRIRQRVVS